jgi:predicted metal-dependent hydrolase
MHYHKLYVAFLYYFNIDEDYFECHEVMEELWIEERRDPLWQGLLQVAVGLYHHSNANISGTIKLFEQSLDKLVGRPDEMLGIKMGELIQLTTDYLERVKKEGAFAFEPFKITITDADLEQLVKSFDPDTLHED